MLQNESIERFKDLGYVLLKDVIPAKCIQGILRELHRLVTHPSKSLDSIELDILNLEAKSHKAVYDAMVTVGSSLAAYKLIVESKLEDYAAMALFGKEGGLHVTPLHVSIQIPRKTDFDYRPHRESEYYPWAPSILNVWFPILASTVTGVTGSIGLVPCSHHNHKRKSTRDKAPGYLQIVSHLTKAEEKDAIEIEADPGDMLIFHQDLVHWTCPNFSNVPRVTGILRIIDQAAMKESRVLYKAPSYSS